MKIFFDTSVLVAAFYADHIHHRPSLDALRRYPRQEAGIGAHSLAETFATLTGMPGTARVRPDTALVYLRSLQERLTLAALAPAEYLPAVEAAAAWGISGRAIYDALLAACALKAAAETICTWNVADFARCGPAVSARLKRPDQLG